MDEFYLPRLKLDRNLIWRVSFKGRVHERRREAGTEEEEGISSKHMLR